MTNETHTASEHFTVEEASRWLTCKQPVPLKLLQKLGKDCSMLCRLRGIQHTLRATPHQPWPNEKAYPADVIREVFAMNPDTAPFLPGGPGVGVAVQEAGSC